MYEANSVYFVMGPLPGFAAVPYLIKLEFSTPYPLGKGVWYFMSVSWDLLTQQFGLVVHQLWNLCM